MNNLFAGLSALAPGVSSQSAETPQDIPKDELMNLCMKMNKRMQAMESKGKELFKNKTTLLMERQKLLDLLKTVMPVPVLTKDDIDLDMTQIEKSWQEFENKRRMQVSDLEEKLVEKEQLMQKSLRSIEEQYKHIVADLQANLNKTTSSSVSDDATAADEGSELKRQEKLAALEATHNSSIAAIVEAEKEKMLAQTALNELQKRVTKGDAEVERLKGVESYLKKQMTTLEMVISAKNSEIESIQKELEAIKTISEEKIVYLQMQLTAGKDKDSQRDKLVAQVAALQRTIEEKDLSYNSNKDMIQALQSRLIEMEPELQQCRDKIATYERNNTAQSVLKAEQSALVASLRNDLKANLEDSEALRKRTRELEEFKVKAEGQLLKMGALSEQVQEFKSVVEEKDSLITRMRSEQQVSERNHAMRTAMLATCEAQLETHAIDLQVKDTTIAETIERVTSLQSALSACEARLAERVKEFNLQIMGYEQKVAAVERDREVSLNTLEKIQEEAIAALNRDHAKKSAMARTLLSEREEEVRVLSAKNQELSEEISSGAPTERKIFELASSQAKRENLHGAHNDTREIAFNQVQSKLAAKDLELAKTQQNLALLQNEVVELRRFHQRDGINMDYLKNIVIQYMTFPAQSSEKLSLVPVLAMLLQFTPAELTSVNRCALMEPVQSSLWGSWGGTSTVHSSKAPKEVKRPTASAPPTTTSNNNNTTSSSSSSGTSGGRMSSSTLTAAYLAKTASSSRAAEATNNSTANNSTAATAVATSVVSPAGLRLAPEGSSPATATASTAASSYQPPLPPPLQAPLSPLSPSSSNSDVEQGSYSPPSMYTPKVPFAPASASASTNNNNNNKDHSGSTSHSGAFIGRNGTIPSPSSLMVESHPDATSLSHTLSTDSTGRRASSRLLGGGFKRTTTPGSKERSANNMNRMLQNRSNSMNSEFEFQQKLKTIGSDILSVSYDVSYDDGDVDAQYVECDDGIEEEDDEDGTSV